MSKSLPANQRRAVIVETVIALAAQQNPSEITTAAIAAHMGLTQGALFRHFPNKEAVLLATMSWVAEHLLAAIDDAVAQLDVQHQGPLAALRAMFMAHSDFAVCHPGVPRLLFSELQRAGKTPVKDVVHDLLGAYKTRLIHLIDQGVATGELAADLNTEAIAILFVGGIQGLIIQSLVADDVGRISREAPGVFALFQRGIQADAAARATPS